MKRSKILCLSLAILSLLVSLLVFSASAAGSAELEIVSKNISYDNDLKFVVAVPKAAVTDSLTFTVVADGKEYAVTKTVSELETDGITDPNLNGVDCYAILSDFGVALKDMSKDYTLTVSSAGKTSQPLSYSVAEYLYERLFKNNIAIAETGTPDGDRKALYFSTLACGADAQRVLYNHNGIDGDNVATFVDELLYSDLTGEEKLYKPGEKIMLSSSVPVYRFVETNGVWIRTEHMLPKGEVTVDAHMIVMPAGLVDFEDGLLSGKYLTVNENSYVTYEVVNEGAPYLSDGKVLKATQNAAINSHGTGLELSLTSPTLGGNIYVLDLDAYFTTPDVTNTTRHFFSIDFGGDTFTFNSYSRNIRVKGVTDPFITGYKIEEWGSYRLVFEVTANGAATVYVYAKDLSGVALTHLYNFTLSGSGITTSGMNKLKISYYNNGNTQNIPYTYYLDNLSFIRTDDTSYIPFAWSSVDSMNLVTEESGDWVDSLKTKFNQATSVTLNSATSVSGNTLIVGNVAGSISDVAYDILEAKLAASSYDDPEGYVIYKGEGSIAIAYSSAVARTEAINELLKIASEEDILASDNDGEIKSSVYSLIERAETSRAALHQSYFDNAEKQLAAAGLSDAKTIRDELEQFFTLFETDTLIWLANLYDKEEGGFYYSNSGRDTIGFLPDLESTSFAFKIMDEGGMFNDFGGLKAHGIPDLMREPMTAWILGMQDKTTGNFYHTQWGSAVGSSRIGRDIDSAVYLLNRLKVSPYYSIPGHPEMTPTGAPSTASAVSLTSPLNRGKVSAVASVVAAAALSLPSYLETPEAWESYLESLDINGAERSYPAGNTICSIVGIVREADNQYEEKTGEKSVYSTIALNFLNETQIGAIGLWEYNDGERANDYDPTDGIGYNGTNGLMKISVAYGGFNSNRKNEGLEPIPMNNAYNALQSAVKVAKYKNTPARETVCYVLNNWTCIANTLGTIASYETENYAAASELVLTNLADMINASYDLLVTHKMPDGGFKYYENSPMNSSQGAPVAYSAVAEADVNSTTVSTTSTIGAMIGVISRLVTGIPSFRLWCSEDYYIFMNELDGVPLVDKSVPEPYTITFDDYGINDEEGESTEANVTTPNEYVYVALPDANYQTSDVVASPRPGAASDDKALFLKTVGSSTDSAKSPMNTYITFANELLEVDNECYLFEADMCLASTTGAIPFQIFFVPATKTTQACGFNICREGGVLKIQDQLVGLDGIGGPSSTKRSMAVNVGDWFNIKFKIYKTYTANSDGTKTLTMMTKVYVNDIYLYTTDCAPVADNVVTDVEIARVQISSYRTCNSEIYIDNVYCEKLDEAYN